MLRQTRAEVDLLTDRWRLDQSWPGGALRKQAGCNRKDAQRPRFHQFQLSVERLFYTAINFITGRPATTHTWATECFSTAYSRGGLPG